MSYGTFSLRWCRLTLIGLGCCCAGLWLALWWRGGSMRLRRVQGFAVRLYLLPFDLIVSDNLENPKLCHAELWHRRRHFLWERINVRSYYPDHPSIVLYPYKKWYDKGNLTNLFKSRFMFPCAKFLFKGTLWVLVIQIYDKTMTKHFIHVFFLMWSCAHFFFT